MSGPSIKRRKMDDCMDDATLAEHVGETVKAEAVYDNFYSPEDSEFYMRFEYSNLDPEKHQTRPVRIYQLQAGQDVRATIKCDTFARKYLDDVMGHSKTMFYATGYPTRTEEMLVDGLKFKAFANLGHALRQARDLWYKHRCDQELLLWVDQVCSNQSNQAERSQEVNFMGDRYSAAKQVLVSLSVEGDPVGASVGSSNSRVRRKTP